jgi:hypothetical protein
LEIKMIKALTEQLSGKIGKGLGLSSKESIRFNRLAQQSEIGGRGVPFGRMNLDDQNAFIGSYNERVAKKASRQTSPQTEKARERKLGSENFTPQEKMEMYEAKRNVRDKGTGGIEPGLGLTRREIRAQEVKANAEAKKARAQKMQREIDRQGGTIEGYYDSPVRRPQKTTGASHQRLGDESPRSAMSYDIERPKAKPIVQQAVESAPGAPNLVQRMFGAPGKDAFADSVSATKTAVESAAENMDSKGAANLKKYVEDQIEEGNILTDSAIGAVKENMEAGLGGGMGLAAQVSKGSTATEFFGGASVTGAVVGGGLLGIGGAAITDSNKTEGAFYGALAGASLGGLARHAAKNIGSYEEGFMKSLLGKNYKDASMNIKKGDSVFSLDDNISLKDIGYDQKFLERHKINTVGDFKSKFNPILSGGRYKAKQDFNASRSQNIKALENMDTSGMGTVDKYKRDLLLGKSNLNVGRVGRMSTMGGAALAGMAFSSSQRDHRRGFNKRRGNRV